MAITTGLLRILEAKEDGVLVLVVEGDLDLQTVPDLCARLTTRRGGRVVIDLSRVRFCDSSGLRAIIGESRETGHLGGRQIVVAPIGGSPRRLFELTGLAEIVEVAETRAEAVGRLRPAIIGGCRKPGTAP